MSKKKAHVSPSHDAHTLAEALSAPAALGGALAPELDLSTPVEVRLKVLQGLAARLGAATGLDDILSLCLATVIDNTALDCGGVYLVDESSGALHLAHSQGLSEAFVDATRHYEADAPSARLIKQGRCVCIEYDKLGLPLDNIRRNEGLHSVAAVPVAHRGTIVACLNGASHVVDMVCANDLAMLETIAAVMGSFVVAAQQEQQHMQSAAEVRRFSEVLKRSRNEIYLFNAESLRFVMVNDGACQNLGYSMQELRQLTPLDIKPEFSAQQFVDLVKPLRSGERAKIEFTTSHRRKDGSLYPVEVHLQLITVDEPVFLAVILDISERVKAEQEKRSLEEQLFHAQKMEAVGRLAGGVAHDFNNVLCAITGNAELLLDDLASTDPSRELVEDIDLAARRATDLTQQLLAFSRKQIINPKVINLSHVIEGLHSMLTRLISEDIVLRTVPQKRLGRVLADPGQVEQIVLNLAVNARDAMQDGGELLIETADVELDQSYCDLHVGTVPGTFVMLAVSDTGCGMSDEVCAKIFEPFFTTKPLGKGTGLGLATVFGIVEQSGGHIQVYSELDRGTSFKVYFPRVDQKADGLLRPQRSELQRGDETVLLVEDEAIVRKTSVKLLKRLGYQVLVAASGAEAIAIAQDHKEPIELLLTDVVMPHINGRELATRITELRPGIKVLYSSGYTQNVIAHHGVIDQGIQFIAKPFSLDALAAKIRQVLESRDSSA